MQHKALQLPMQGADASALRDLVASCSAATFGRSNPKNPRGGLCAPAQSYCMQSIPVTHRHRFSVQSSVAEINAAKCAQVFQKQCCECCAEGADVLDPSYRKALKLDVECFATNINLSELGILAHIKTLMAPDAADIRAELYKLNM